MASQLRPDRLGDRWAHICVDMQIMFRNETVWAFDWPESLVPNVASICRAARNRNLFTRFLPAQNANEGQGTWLQLYQRWPEITVGQIGAEKLQVVGELAEFHAADHDIVKHVYSPWGDSKIENLMHELDCKAVVISGIETDLCVLATVFGAVDRGYRTILLHDAVASSVIIGHDAVLQLLQTRLGAQLEFAGTVEFLERLASE